MPELKVRIGCVVLAVVMSAVTYYFVEPRLRWGRFGGYKAAGLLSVMVVIGVAGYSVERHDGYTARMNDPEQPVIDAISQRMEEDNLRCLSVIPDWNNLSDGISRNDGTICKMQREPGKNTIALIGDSHAQHLYPGLTTQMQESDGVAVFPAGCAIPLIGLHSAADPYMLKLRPAWAYTEHLLSEAFDYIINHKNIEKVVLAHHTQCSWNNVVDTQNPGNHDFESILSEGFARTYKVLTNAGKQIYVVLDNPVYANKNWQKCMASVIRRPIAIPDFLNFKKIEICQLKSSALVERTILDNWKKVSHEKAQGYKNIHFIDLEQVFCPNEICSMLDRKGNMLYRDEQHLNIKGSIYASPFIINHLRK